MADVNEINDELQRYVLPLLDELKRRIKSLEEESLAAQRREKNLIEILSSREPVLIVNYSMTYDGATKESVLVRDKTIIKEFEKTRDLVYLERVVSPMVEGIYPGDIIIHGTVMVNTH